LLSGCSSTFLCKEEASDESISSCLGIYLLIFGGMLFFTYLNPQNRPFFTD